MSESIRIKAADDHTPTIEAPFKWGPGTPRGAKVVRVYFNETGRKG